MLKIIFKFSLVMLILFVGACGNDGRTDSEAGRIRDQAKGKPPNRVFASTYFGGKGHEFCEAIALDDEGNVYIAGNTRSADFPTTEGTQNQNIKGESDVFVAKFDNELKTLLASTLIGGDEDECAYSMLFDTRGFLYIAGYTSSANFPTTAQSYDEKYNGGDGDAFILKMDNNLKKLLSSTFLGGSGTEDDWRSPELVQDKEGNIYIAGITASEDFPTTSDAFQMKYNGGQRDVFLSKFDPDLKHLLSSTLLGGGGDDRMGRSLEIDYSHEEICVGGYTYSADFPTSPDAFGKEISGHLDGFVSKLSLDLKVLTASTILKAGWIYSLMIHESGDIYVGGHAANELVTTEDAFYKKFDKASDQGFIVRMSNDLSKLLASTLIPGSYASGGGRITSLNLLQSNDGQVLSAGWAGPLDFPVTPGVYDETQNGNSDAYILKMDRDLSKVTKSTFIGGSRSERWNRMAADGKGCIYLASYTLSADFPTNSNSVFQFFSEVITDKTEDLNTSPRDAVIIKIDENLSAEVYEDLHEAAKRNQVDNVRRLLAGDDTRLEKRDKYQRTPLHSAARFGAISVARFLLDQGADENSKDESGNSPLHLASMFCHDEIVDLLIQHKADVNLLNAKGQAPLYLASLYGNPESIRHLLANGANMNQSDPEGDSPLHIAVLYRRAENLVELLDFDPEIDAANAEGFTPLLLAVRRPENEKAIEILLEKGADANTTDSRGRNALLVSVDSHQKHYITLLAAIGVDINSQDNDGNTALHYIFRKALENKMYIPLCKEIAKPLLAEGANPQIKNKSGKSPMDLALESEEDELIVLLRSSK